MTLNIGRNADHESPGDGSRDRIRTVTGATFEELVLDAQGPVVAEFMSYGCTHCRVMEPILQQVAGMVDGTSKVPLGAAVAAPALMPVRTTTLLTSPTDAASANPLFRCAHRPKRVVDMPK